MHKIEIMLKISSAVFVAFGLHILIQWVSVPPIFTSIAYLGIGYFLYYTEVEEV